MRQISEPSRLSVIVNDEITVRGQSPDDTGNMGWSGQAGFEICEMANRFKLSAIPRPSKHSPWDEEDRSLSPGSTSCGGCPDPKICPPPFAPGFTIAECYLMECKKRYPDEYICDGGDRGPARALRFCGYSGLETEDMLPSSLITQGKNESSPRAACVSMHLDLPPFRSVSVPAVGEAVSELANVAGSTGDRSMRAQTKIDQSAQQTPTGGLRMRSRSSGLESTSGQGDFASITRLAAHEKLINLFQDIGFLRTGFDGVDGRGCHSAGDAGFDGLEP